MYTNYKSLDKSKEELSLYICSYIYIFYWQSHNIITQGGGHWHMSQQILLHEFICMNPYEVEGIYYYGWVKNPLVRKLRRNLHLPLLHDSYYPTYLYKNWWNNTFPTCILCKPNTSKTIFNTKERCSHESHMHNVIPSTIKLMLSRAIKTTQTSCFVDFCGLPRQCCNLGSKIEGSQRALKETLV